MLYIYMMIMVHLISRVNPFNFLTLATGSCVFSRPSHFSLLQLVDQILAALPGSNLSLDLIKTMKHN